MNKYDVHGRVVLITGSTGGLGTELAIALHDAGAKLALLDLDLDAANAQARLLGSEEVAKGWAVDVRSLESVTSAIDAAAQHFGGIDVVIAAAGIAKIGTVAEGSVDDFEAVIDINLLGAWRTLRAAAPYVVDRQGYLLAVSSMAAFVHPPLMGSYNASKAGIWAMCDAMRLELRPTGTAVGTLHPTFFKTPMVDAAMADPATQAMAGDDRANLFRLVPIEVVVAAVIDGIEKRSNQIIVPRNLKPAAALPGLMRAIISQFGSKDEAIVRATEVLREAEQSR